ncbi:Nitrilase/cyanide hydratase and apolipoprotein N-acyltransferase [Novosphingobium resinovorum]|uniref:Nitrilase/cyanide hydratase and apolipoprotein N-acyltransferase n=2 Tax=Novosphingobium resinovorum TaxID=158500 RepID=A0A031K7C5_9SPHN|nr:Nitrilase/cyanide hydratase and apolipoprotein N-acyltransferase [Novosphingobium resinovorum]
MRSTARASSIRYWGSDRMTRAALFQMTTGIDPQANAAAIVDAVVAARAGGAAMLFTPEMSGLLDRKRERAREAIRSEADDPVLAAVREAARREGIWVHIGSLAIAREDGKWANRAFVIDDAGEIRARYDKMHMFDVDLSTGESWRESNAYVAGDEVVTVETPLGRLGLAICYDVRFPALFEALGRARCDVIAIPAAFTVPTGKAHWHLMQRARAVEASAYVLSAAQCGRHDDGRETYGHSLAIDPWGEVLLDMGGADDGGTSGVGFVDLDAARIAEVRGQLPSLANRRTIAK